MRTTLGFSVAMLLVCAGAFAQLPPDAVMLDKVKVSEQQKSHELDPVTLEAADPGLGTFEHGGVTYGMSSADSKDTFMSDPAKFAAQHDRARWEFNFTHSMSEIWCPVTDEISPGGNTKWTMLDLSWESCCQFCNDTKTDEDFPRALERLKKRATQSYELIGGANYTEGASSPVEGAINLGGPPQVATATPEPAQEEYVPDWLKGADLQATYAGGVAKIFEKRCVECHRPGGAAPMPMQTLGQIRQWKKNLRTHLVQGLMPPWPADTKNSFSNGKNLTDKEKEVLLAWIDGGYAPGEGQYTPEKEWGEWGIGTPDHVFEMGEHTLGENVGEHVAEYEIATSFDEDKWVVAAEVKPTDSFLTLEVDAGPLGAYHSGNGTIELPDGHAFLLKKGQTVTVKVFYTKEEGWEEFDTDTKMAVKFASNPASITGAVQVARMANDSFMIPAGSDSTTASSEFTFAADGHILSVNPVVRLRGKSVKVSAKFPDGKEQEILSIPRFDTMWHFRYALVEPLAAPKGTVVTMTATYDNSDMNAQNPDSSVEVKAGPGGELLEGWLSYTLEGSIKSAENRFGLTVEQLMASTGTCSKCAAEAGATEAVCEVHTD